MPELLSRGRRLCPEEKTGYSSTAAGYQNSKPELRKLENPNFKKAGVAFCGSYHSVLSSAWLEKALWILQFPLTHVPWEYCIPAKSVYSTILEWEYFFISSYLWGRQGSSWILHSLSLHPTPRLQCLDSFHAWSCLFSQSASASKPLVALKLSG